MKGECKDMSEDKSKIFISMQIDREMYNAYKSIIVRNGENVKGSIVRYMQEVIRNDGRMNNK